MGFVWGSGESGQATGLRRAAGAQEESHQSIVLIATFGSVIISVSEAWHGSWFAAVRGAWRDEGRSRQSIIFSAMCFIGVMSYDPAPGHLRQTAGRVSGSYYSTKVLSAARATRLWQRDQVVERA